jgi:H+-transporting ATPase
LRSPGCNFLVPQVQALMFAYLMYSAQATIYLSQRRLVLVTAAWQARRRCHYRHVVLATVLLPVASYGACLARVLVSHAGAGLLIALLLDQVKIWLFSKNREEELRQC